MNSILLPITLLVHQLCPCLTSEAILNWERPSYSRSSHGHFTDEDQLLLKQLSRMQPGKYQYKPSSALIPMDRPSKREDVKDGETLASHLTKLAASSSNNNFQNVISGHSLPSSYLPMDVIPVSALKTSFNPLSFIDDDQASSAPRRKQAVAVIPTHVQTPGSLNSRYKPFRAEDGDNSQPRRRRRQHDSNRVRKHSDEEDENEENEVSRDQKFKEHRHSVEIPTWGYEDEDKWGKSFPSCDGISQSPINVHPKSVVAENNLNIIFMSSYRHLLERAELLNNGRTVEVEYKGGARPAITGSAVYDDVYLFQQLHFHWGNKNTIGSEHAVFGQKFPAELHLVHYNEKYGTFKDAVLKPDGLVVIAVFFQVSSKDNPRLDELITSLADVKCGGESIDFDHKMSVSFLLPTNRQEFYRYTGSLTTPPCAESVTWIILKHGLLIGRNQLRKFRELKQGNCVTPILNNWRNIQPTNGRKVDKTSTTIESGSSGRPEAASQPLVAKSK